jgi:hypothetical protein
LYINACLCIYLFFILIIKRINFLVAA